MDTKWPQTYAVFVSEFHSVVVVHCKLVFDATFLLHMKDQSLAAPLTHTVVVQEN